MSQIFQKVPLWSFSIVSGQRLDGSALMVAPPTFSSYFTTPLYSSILTPSFLDWDRLLDHSRGEKKEEKNTNWAFHLTVVHWEGPN